MERGPRGYWDTPQYRERERRPFCPLSPPSEELHCMQERCGWWDLLAGCCAITAISLRLGKLAQEKKEHEN